MRIRKKTPLYLLLVILLFAACRKEEEVRTYPIRFRKVDQTTDFKVWIRDTDQTTRFEPAYFFGSYLSAPEFEFALVSSSRLCRIRNDRPNDTLSCFFRNDSLFVVSPRFGHPLNPVPVFDTVLFATGSIYALETNYARMATGVIDSIFWTSAPFLYFTGRMNGEQFKDEFGRYDHGNELDTIAVHQQTTFFK